MKLMKTEEAVGHVLCHDITQIIKDEKKGPVFRKGHIIQPEDVPVLLSVGKDHIYIWENDETMLHEDEAAAILRDLCMSENMHATEPKEGKIELIADIDGLLLIDLERLRAVNSLGDMMIATRASGFVVKKGDKLCGTRVVPLVIEKARMEKAKEVAGPELRPHSGHLHPRHRGQAARIRRLGDGGARSLERRPREDHRRHPGHAGSWLRDGPVQRRHERGPG